MIGELYPNLSWLPPAPADFITQCAAIFRTDGDLGRPLQSLANHALDENQLNRLARVIARARESGRSLAPLTPFRLGIVSNGTTNFIVPALIASAARHGIALHCIEANFDQVVQEALSSRSAVSRAEPDAVLVAVDHRGLPLRSCPGDGELAGQTVKATLAHLAMIRSGIKDNSKAICIMQTIARPPEEIFGSLDLTLPGTVRNLVDGVNRGIAESIRGTEDLLFDVAALAETVGLANWHDPTLWNLAKLPFSDVFLPLYADRLARVIAALRGKSRRCLILDLDNTLWSGVIGDDGIEGIVIGPGDPTGEAHLAVQQVALDLRDRGIVLAISSKNHDEVARLPFQKHPGMLLREDHIAVFQANWDDKATNIKAIADSLSLGLDAMVFLDDNPAERALVRRLLPEVAVPELPSDPALYARTLLAGGYFEAAAFSDEDGKRAEFYQDNARRVALQQKAGDIESYLVSLEMVMTVQPFDETGRRRIAQLINKSNQFNLTTRRYSEAEVREIEQDPDCFTLQAWLTDRFGDNGMISVVICRRAGADWVIDTWLMSCRVLGRRVEQALLQELLAAARDRSISRLVGRYMPSGRNRLVEDHYAKLGFNLVEQRADLTTVWEMPTAEPPTASLPMEIRRLGRELAIA